jgi:hypothetical protein
MRISAHNFVGHRRVQSSRRTLPDDRDHEDRAFMSHPGWQRASATKNPAVTFVQRRETDSGDGRLQLRSRPQVPCVPQS